MKADLYLRGATIVTELGAFHGGALARDGRIAAIVEGAPRLEAARVIECAGRIVLPGIVDAHVHFSEPGRAFEGYRSGSRAAAAGGVTTILDMPLNDLPPTADRPSLLAKRALAEGRSVVDYGFWGGLIDDNLDRLAEQNAEGIVAFKAFMTHVPDYPRVDDDLMYAGLKEIARLGNMLGVHAENEGVTQRLRAEFLAQGKTGREHWPAARPPEQELEAIERAIFWAKAAGARLHIVHVSIAEGVRAVTRARREGVAVTCETCAHFLFFDADDHVAVGPLLRSAPPVRDRKEQAALWDCVLAGEVDAITSDHSPFPPERYAGAAERSIFEGGGGVLGLQSLLPAVLTAGVRNRGMPLPLVAKLMSGNPARIFGLYPKKGAMLPGSDADFTVVDPARAFTLRRQDLFYRHPQSPYVGRTFQGVVTQTILRGRVVFEGGAVVAEAGYGRLLKRAA